MEIDVHGYELECCAKILARQIYFNCTRIYKGARSNLGCTLYNIEPRGTRNRSVWDEDGIFNRAMERGAADTHKITFYSIGFGFQSKLKRAFGLKKGKLGQKIIIDIEFIVKTRYFWKWIYNWIQIGLDSYRIAFFVITTYWHSSTISIKLKVLLYWRRHNKHIRSIIILMIITYCLKTNWSDDWEK